MHLTRVANLVRTSIKKLDPYPTFEKKPYPTIEEKPDPTIEEKPAPDSTSKNSQYTEQTVF